MRCVVLLQVRRTCSSAANFNSTAVLLEGCVAENKKEDAKCFEAASHDADKRPV